MRYKQLSNRWIVQLDKGEEIVETLKHFCKNHGITLGLITGIGATNKVTIGLFDVKTKQYYSQEFIGDYEIAPLYGNISTKNNEIYLHIHINICDANHHAFGGHLTSAIVSATFEGIIETIDGKIERVFDAETGLNRYKF
jgi:hypothetical protein